MKTTTASRSKPPNGSDGFSTIFPTTAPVEADFSRIRETTSDFEENLTHLGLEALLQRRQC